MLIFNQRRQLQHIFLIPVSCPISSCLYMKTQRKLIADKFSFNVTKQFTPSCCYTELREWHLLGHHMHIMNKHSYFSIIIIPSNPPLLQQPPLPQPSFDYPQPAWHTPTTPASTRQPMIPCHQLQEPGEYQPTSMDVSLPSTLSTAAAMTTMNDDGWEVGEE